MITTNMMMQNAMIKTKSIMISPTPMTNFLPSLSIKKKSFAIPFIDHIFVFVFPYKMDNVHFKFPTNLIKTKHIHGKLGLVISSN
jgi:hypothetical protein